MTDRRSAEKHLIIFTRYPKPGKAKTRLIPALGAAGAAALHRQMAEHTVSQARLLQGDVDIDVLFVGGDRAQMQDWLGHDLHYHPQSVGDLGDRITHAFQSAFDRGAKFVVAIGTDCPDLDASLLTLAFQKLVTHDLVIGSATDGGYYLIGLHYPIPDLFQNITWSTSIVYQQTIAIAEKLQLSIANLPMLSDIDRPEDLEKF
ncbi:glycosyltransferase [Phormidesmis priestleyi ULC007]|uniref:Glycosyltransferase n=1 Tax=Phormidesmis priestleyi ULC007 TaxID=1920490 RepID=A0A2T1DBA9_9CYAN|nr:TIGR04282 family arsenosugar biosynthesis glycosyltransferase [Phormidesmis priestleyi]PSB17769.1 glycosyltransferase [Phormidesmis priestleyi ULC007]PZO48711.1 MAG: glycosyltransferase [Phormidesmis priestleyi]